MLNFRSLRQDFPSGVLKNGKQIFDQKGVLRVAILQLDVATMRLHARVQGSFEHVYELEIEIDRKGSSLVDSNCDCPARYDCAHLTALLFYLEQHLDELLVAYSKEVNVQDMESAVQATLELAEEKVDQQKETELRDTILSDYQGAAALLGSSPFFISHTHATEEEVELACILLSQPEASKEQVDLTLALRVLGRSKPLHIPNIHHFLQAVHTREPLVLGGKKYFLKEESFEPQSHLILSFLMHHLRAHSSSDERYLKIGQISKEALGELLATLYATYCQRIGSLEQGEDGQGVGAGIVKGFYVEHIEEPLFFGAPEAALEVHLDLVSTPIQALTLQPRLRMEGESVKIEDVCLLESVDPGVFYQGLYYRFLPQVRRAHLKSILDLERIAIPIPLIGTFVEQSLPILQSFATVMNLELLHPFATLPFTGKLQGTCRLQYLEGELDAELEFHYGDLSVPAMLSQLSYEQLRAFETAEGVLARQLVEEQAIMENLFEGFQCDEREGKFRLKSEKKIIEFMTEVIPRFQEVIQFESPENLSQQFVYDNSTFTLTLAPSDRVDLYEVALKVEGALKGISLDQVWDCLVTKKRFLELNKPKSKKSGLPKILVLDLDYLTPIISLLEEMGITRLDSHVHRCPLWSLTMVRPDEIAKLPITFSMSPALMDIQKQMLGEVPLEPSSIPDHVQADLRHYQKTGVEWLQRLRQMHLGGILADDMGLGKTLQAIVALCQREPGAPSLIVSPTSLVYNWAAELRKFAPHLKVLVIDAAPVQRKALIERATQFDILITSYNLLQKDVESYQKQEFYYFILDEAQYIKNRGTRNAKSVKRLNATHRLILTGTPIENSLDELWSLFDFLMPGLLSSYDRFVDRFVRKNRGGSQKEDALEILKRKVSPFILRRMKKDVLEELPPVSEIEYRCALTPTQKMLYQSYAASAKEELTRLVDKEGFDKIQIHVLATLTRLKQICCHPAIFAKERAEIGDSAKYDLLLELLNSLMVGGHKTVIFSQYTKMLGIIRAELESRQIPFAYLDGSSKHRLEIVDRFNEDRTIPFFLVSLKAGGAGLNLVGADTVIHYDMWWNPAVEHQATDRVHRLGQTQAVSAYKLITSNTIEEKIVELQKRKQGLVKKLISSDDEAITKLSWEEVLELLQT